MEMSRFNTTSSRRLRTWWDRINRYRVAAGFLYVPFILAMITLVTGHELMAQSVRRSVYWIGLFLLTVALAMDAWEVYSGKRQVKRMIATRLKQDQEQ